MTNTTTKIQILRDALTDEHTWLADQRKAISKGCRSSWDMMQCDERMGLIAEAMRLTEGAQDAPGDILAARRAMFAAFSKCIAEGDKMLPQDIADTLIRATLTHPAPTPTAEVMGGEVIALVVDNANGKWAALVPGVVVSGGDRLYKHPAPKASTDADEDAYVIERLGKLLAGVAVALNGPEPELTRWSYHDLPEKAAVMALELDLYKTVFGDKVPEGWENECHIATPAPKAITEPAANPCTSNSLERQNPQNVDGKADAAEPCKSAAHMGEHACVNRHQCWEPCGELGHSAEHAKRAPEATP